MENDFRNRFRSSGLPKTSPMPARSVKPAQDIESATIKPVLPDMPTYNQAPTTPRSRSTPSRPRKSRKRILIVTIIVLILVIGLVVTYAYRRNNYSENIYKMGNGQQTPPPGDGVPDGTLPASEQTGTLRLVATGDMIAHDSVNANAKKSDGSYDYLPLMSDMKQYFEKADIRFCNQSTPAGGEKYGISGYPVFNAPLAFPAGIRAVGCNLINIGTNHTNDKGQPLIDATVAAWDNTKGILAVAGANRTVSEQNQQRIFTIKGTKVAFLSYSTYTNNKALTPYGVNMYSDTLASTQISAANQAADIVIVSMRWGTEYSPEINALQNTIAQKLTDLGVDVILGHGPHVLEPVKKLKSAKGDHESVVWYSLGNFLNTQVETEALIGGFAIMDYDVATKKLTNTSFMPTYMHYEWTAAQKASNNLLARKNLTMVPLDKAQELLAKSLLNTTVEAQTARVKKVLNQYTPVKIIKSTEY